MLKQKTNVFSKTRGLHNFYSMSYLYFGAMATSSVVIAGIIVSYVTGKNTKRLRTQMKTVDTWLYNIQILFFN